MMSEEKSKKEIIKDLCRKKTDHLIAFKDIVSLVKGEKEKSGNFGFTMSDVRKMNPHFLGVLKSEGIIKATYESHKRHDFWIPDDLKVEDIEEAIKEVEEEKEEAEPIQLVPGTLVTFNKKWLEEWEQMLANGVDMVNYWTPEVNPKVIKLEDIKRIALLSLASAGDKFGDRGRIHLLMWGDPGTAKSTIGGWLVYRLGIIGASHRTSDVGLTGDARGETIEPGILPIANEKAVYIDELDKFSEKDRYGLLESMEEGEVIIHAGKIHIRLPARCRVIASANVIDGFAPELLDRFDFKIELRVPEVEEEKEITSKIVEQWRIEKEGYYGEKLRAYLDWIKSYEPEIPGNVRERTDILLQAFIDMREEVRGSIRKKESILRVAYTIAKLNRREMKTDDVIQAITILYPEVNNGLTDILKKLAAEKS